MEFGSKRGSTLSVGFCCRNGEVSVSPQSSLTDFVENGLRDLSALTEAEREVYVALDREGTPVRQLARETDRRPGTVGNLLERARACASTIAKERCPTHGDPAGCGETYRLFGELGVRDHPGLEGTECTETS